MSVIVYKQGCLITLWFLSKNDVWIYIWFVKSCTLLILLSLSVWKAARVTNFNTVGDFT